MSVPDSPWQKNAGSQIVLDSIFAALAAVWITFAIGDDKISNVLKFFETGTALLSFFFFAISAEGTTNACDEDDVVKYVYYLLWYNAGVVLIAIAILVLSHFDPHFVTFLGSWFWYLRPAVLRVAIHLVYVSFFFMVLWRWIHDFIWLLFKKRSSFDLYLKELAGEAPPERNRHWLMRRAFCHRL
jgi:hypothetical protein